MGITQKIEVSVGYYDFNFDDVDQAIAFAKMAALTNQGKKKATATIIFEDQTEPKLTKEEAGDTEEDTEDE